MNFEGDLFKKVCMEAEKVTSKNLNEIDTGFLVDLLLEMANDFRDSVISWAATNISHRYKIANTSKDYLVPDWKITVNNTITELNRKFRRSPSLRKWLLKNWDEAFEDAKKDYATAQIKYKDLPDITDLQCPYGLDDILVRF